MSDLPIIPMPTVPVGDDMLATVFAGDEWGMSYVSWFNGTTFWLFERDGLGWSG